MDDDLSSLQQHEKRILKHIRNREAHAVVFYVPYGTLFDKDYMKVLKDKFQRIAACNFTPLVMVGRVDEHDVGLRANPTNYKANSEIMATLSSIATSLTAVQANIMVAMPYTHEESRTFHIDKLSALNLTRIINSAHVKARKIAEAKVRPATADGLIFGDEDDDEEEEQALPKAAPTKRASPAVKPPAPPVVRVSRTPSPMAGGGAAVGADTEDDGFRKAGKVEMPAPSQRRSPMAGAALFKQATGQSSAPK
jgi:hypothetical protein